MADKNKTTKPCANSEIKYLKYVVVSLYIA